MQFVSAGLRHHIDVGARISSVTRVVCRGLDFEFLNRIRVGNWKRREEATVIPNVETRPVVDRCSIHLVIILGIVGPIDGDDQPSLAKSRGVIHVGAGTSGHGNQVYVIAGTEGKRRHGTRPDDVAQCGARCLNNFRIGLHGDGLCFRTHAQAAVQYRSFGHVNLNRRHLDDSESLGLKFDAVSARLQQAEFVTAICSGCSHAALAVACVCCCDHRTGNRGA